MFVSIFLPITLASCSSNNNDYSITISGEDNIVGYIDKQITPIHYSAHDDKNTHINFSVQNLPSGLEYQTSSDNNICNIVGIPQGNPTQGKFIITAYDGIKVSHKTVTYDIVNSPFVEQISIQGAHPIDSEIAKPITPLNLTCVNRYGSVESQAVFSFGDDSLVPPNIQLTDNGDGTATISGTPRVIEDGSFQVEAKVRGEKCSTTIQYSFTTSLETMFSLRGLHNIYGQVAQPITPLDIFAIDATGNNVPCNFYISNGQLPDGVTLVNNPDGTATISGIPSASNNNGWFDFVAKSKINDVMEKMRVNWYIFSTIDDKIYIDGASNIKGLYDAPINSITLTAKKVIDGTIATNARFSDFNDLPSGISLTDNFNGTATISGTPSVSGNGSFQIKATLNLSYDIFDINWSIDRVNDMFTITGGHNLYGVVGDYVDMTLYCYTLNQQLVNDAHFFIKDGTLPTGVSMISNINGHCSFYGQVTTVVSGQFNVCVNLDTTDNTTVLAEINIKYEYSSVGFNQDRLHIEGGQNISLPVGADFDSDNMSLRAFDTYHKKITSGLTWSIVGNVDTLPYGLELKQNQDPNSPNYGMAYFEGTLSVAGSGEFTVQVEKQDYIPDSITIHWTVHPAPTAQGISGPTDINLDYFNTDWTINHYYAMDPYGNHLYVNSFTIDDSNFDDTKLEYDFSSDFTSCSLGLRILDASTILTLSTTLTITAVLFNNKSISATIHIYCLNPNWHKFDSINKTTYMSGPINGSTVYMSDDHLNYARVNNISVKLLDLDRIHWVFDNSLSVVTDPNGNKRIPLQSIAREYDDIWNFFQIALNITVFWYHKTNPDTSTDNYAYGNYSTSGANPDKQWLNATVNGTTENDSVAVYRGNKSGNYSFSDWFNYSELCWTPTDEYYIITRSNISLFTTWGYKYDSTEHQANVNVW